MNVDYSEHLKMFDSFLKWKSKGPKKANVYVASGIRHDLALRSKDYINILTRHFVGGHLKVAPEHYCPLVLELMGKPRFELFEEFENRFDEANRKAGKIQYLVPYFISGHPGCSDNEAIQLTDYLVRRRWRPRQTQDFVPVPLTLSTAMFVSGRDSKSRQIHIPSGRKEKRLQASLLHYWLPANLKNISQFLSSKGRGDLFADIKRLFSITKQAKNPADGRSEQSEHSWDA
jgi:radical SAM superfamily enzyme YgiQ (UPF0313 family)